MATTPFDHLPQVPPFRLTSAGVRDGYPFAPAQLSGFMGIPGGLDRSPALRWEGAPAQTQSYVVTMYDADAPTGSGFWHWAVANIPATTSELPEGAGGPDGAHLPDRAIQLPNDARAPHFLGAAPPAGHGPHRYFITVHALDVPELEIAADATPALLGFTMLPHVIARAVLVATAESAAPDQV